MVTIQDRVETNSPYSQNFCLSVNKGADSEHSSKMNSLYYFLLILLPLGEREIIQ